MAWYRIGSFLVRRKINVLKMSQHLQKLELANAKCQEINLCQLAWHIPRKHSLKEKKGIESSLNPGEFKLREHSLYHKNGNSICRGD